MNRASAHAWVQTIVIVAAVSGCAGGHYGGDGGVPDASVFDASVFDASVFDASVPGDANPSGDSGADEDLGLTMYTVSSIAGNGMSSTPMDGQGASAELVNPSGLAIDSAGNLYVAEAAAIRKIDSGGNVTTVAGNGTAGFMDGTGGLTGTARFSDPTGIA